MSKLEQLDSQSTDEELQFALAMSKKEVDQSEVVELDPFKGIRNLQLQMALSQSKESFKQCNQSSESKKTAPSTISNWVETFACVRANQQVINSYPSGYAKETDSSQFMCSIAAKRRQQVNHLLLQRSSMPELQKVCPETIDEEELQLEVALAMSKEEADLSVLKENDNLRLQIASFESNESFKHCNQLSESKETAPKKVVQSRIVSENNEEVVATSSVATSPVAAPVTKTDQSTFDNPRLCDSFTSPSGLNQNSISVVQPRIDSENNEEVATSPVAAPAIETDQSAFDKTSLFVDFVIQVKTIKDMIFILKLASSKKETALGKMLGYQFPYDVKIKIKNILQQLKLDLLSTKFKVRRLENVHRRRLLKKAKTEVISIFINQDPVSDVEVMDLEESDVQDIAVVSTPKSKLTPARSFPEFYQLFDTIKDRFEQTVEELNAVSDMFTEGFEDAKLLKENGEIKLCNKLILRVSKNMINQCKKSCNMYNFL